MPKITQVLRFVSRNEFQYPEFFNRLRRFETVFGGSYVNAVDAHKRSRDRRTHIVPSQRRYYCTGDYTEHELTPAIADSNRAR